MLRPDPRSGLKRVNDADFSFAYPDYSLLHRHTPAKAEYPGRCGFSIPSLAPRNTGSPAFCLARTDQKAGDDGAVRDAQRIATASISRVQIWLLPYNDKVTNTYLIAISL
jgi:hypothetical protein